MRHLPWLPLLFVVACAPATKSSAPSKFPPGFDLGFATVAYQSEGSLGLDGVTPVQSNWREWQEAGRISDGQTNDFGNGFLTHYDEDIARAAELGSTAFSYAVDWARLEPAPGAFNEAEFARVEAIVDSIRSHGMKPVVVLFHWVTPLWVQSMKDQRDLLTQNDTAFVDAFLPLVDALVPRLAGKVDTWVTFEEPNSIAGGEYLGGIHPPGRVLDVTSAMRALVNLMYLNARVYHRVKELDLVDADGDGQAAFVGFENLAFQVLPVDAAKPADVRAAERVDYLLNKQFLNGIWNGVVDVDLDGKSDTPDTDPPERHDASLERTVDFIGLNYYGVVRADPGYLASLEPLRATPHYDVRDYDATLPHSDAWLEVSPTGLRKTIEAYSVYGVPLLITENGDPDADDDERPGFLLDHLAETARAVADGYDVRGYYYWTISDNFEWQDGLHMKEGLFQVDFTRPDFPRARTRSADLFSDVAHQRGLDQDLIVKWRAAPQGPTQ